jgi:N-methylhydantoinase B/oxoprolinase/acetone carboxylase alpha subunit
MTSRAIELELYRQMLVAIAEEMGTVLRKTSFSANIKERRDYSCAIYDRRGETIAMGDHMPVHLGAMPLSVREVLRAFDLGPGDVAIVNDPFRGGTHLPDITAVAGVFARGERRPEYYAATRAHHADVGGISPGSMPLASEIFQEGIRIPPVLIRRRGRIVREWLDLILANVRTPVEREGDLMAQLMAIERGQQRLDDLLQRFGRSRARSLAAALQDYSEAMLVDELKRLPEGVYRFEDRLDGGARVQVAVTLKDGHATADFTGSSPQQDAPVNANEAIVLSASMYVFRCLIREQTPYTSGLMRRIRVIAPAGSIVNALPPAAMAAGNVETSQRITDVLLGALAQAAPDRIPAASSGTMSNFSFGGRASGGRAFAYYETIAGGMGAGPGSPGRSGTHTHMTNSWNTPIEAMEHQYPIRVRAYSLRRGSGGKGRYPGGDGIVREFEFLEPAECTLLADRRETAPYGLAGGWPGATGAAFLNGKRLPGRVRFQAATGDRVRIETPGGGGWGKL